MSFQNGKEEKNMGDNQLIINGLCRHCGCNQAQAAADARALSFEEKFASGIYTCCQVEEWAQEQWSAWVEATRQDAGQADEVMNGSELDEPEATLVPVRLRRPVPWFKNPDGLR